MDDSGTRHPDKNPGRVPAHGHDWFALGGVLIDAAQEGAAREAYERFRKKWNIIAPLHSTEIRNKSKHFAWIGKLEKSRREKFHDDLFGLMVEIDVTGLACVIDRPGYNARYLERYRDDRWLLCKTAFCIAVERAAKFALRHNAKLRVLPEKCSKKDDRQLRQYYNDLRLDGCPFDLESAEVYKPLDVTSYQTTLRELRFKEKSSPLVQLADLYLWPMAIGGYDLKNRPYAKLVEASKLIDQHCEEVSLEGIKYSCFQSGAATA